MNIVNKTIIYHSRSDVFTLIGLGDCHLGNVGFETRKFLDTIDEIKNNRNYLWVGTGDYIEAINFADKRFDPKSIDPCYDIKDISRLVQIQIEDMVSYLKPIADKCLGICVGNHEETIRLSYYYDVGDRMSKALAVP